MKNESSTFAQRRKSGISAKAAPRRPRLVERWISQSSRAVSKSPQVPGETMAGVAIPPPSTPPGARTAPSATAEQTAAHHFPGPGRRMPRIKNAVKRRASAFSATSAPAPTCSDFAAEPIGSVGLDGESP